MRTTTAILFLGANAHAWAVFALGEFVLFWIGELFDNLAEMHRVEESVKDFTFICRKAIGGELERSFDAFGQVLTVNLSCDLVPLANA